MKYRIVSYNMSSRCHVLREVSTTDKLIGPEVQVKLSTPTNHNARVTLCGRDIEIDKLIPATYTTEGELLL